MWNLVKAVAFFIGLSTMAGFRCLSFGILCLVTAADDLVADAGMELFNLGVACGGVTPAPEEDECDPGS